MTEAQARYRELVAAGICPGCKGQPQPGRIRCRRCQDVCKPKSSEAIRNTIVRGRRWHTKERQRRKLCDLCTSCGKEKDPGRTECAHCRRAKLMRQRRRRGATWANRRCSYCRQPGHFVTACEVKAQAYRQALLMSAAGSRVAQ